MSQRIQRHDSSPNIPSRGRAYTYVLPCRDEDILKIGFSRDPLARLQTLHTRYFDFFEIDLAFLIETDHVRDARRIERELARDIADHRAPSPIVVSRNAAGHTEWFRRAYGLVSQAAELAAAEFGYVCHAPLREWLRQNLIQRGDKLFEWSAHMLDAIQIHQPLSADLARPLERVLLDRLDAYAAVGLSPDSLIPHEVSAWYQSERMQQ